MYRKSMGWCFYLDDFILILFITDVEAENAADVELQLPGEHASLNMETWRRVDMRVFDCKNVRLDAVIDFA